MADSLEEHQEKIKRSLGMEFAAMETTFDNAALLRERLTSRLVAEAAVVEITTKGDDGSRLVNDSTPAALALVNTALKAIEQTEKAAVSQVSMKLRHSEQEAASAAQAQDRITVVLQATRPGAIKDQAFEPAALEHQLEEMFDAQIKDFELKSSPNDLDD